MDRLRRAKFEHDIPFDSFDYAPFDELRTSKTGSLRVVRDVEPRTTKDEMRVTGNGKMFHVKQLKRRREMQNKEQPQKTV